MSTLPTDPIRQEHLELIPHLQELASAAVEVGGWLQEVASDRLHHIIDFLSNPLLPHAAAEEEILYPAIDEALGAPATATMQVDHEEIATRVAKLSDRVGTALDVWPDSEQVSDISRQLSALAAIVTLHFRKEEEVLLPVLDTALSVEEAAALFASMDDGHHQHT